MGVFSRYLPPALPIDYAETEAIHSKTLANGITTLLLTSSIPGEGTSTIAYALAQRAASSGKRVLLADFNVHNPFSINALHLPAAPWGLGAAFDADAIVPIPGRDLHVLPAPLQGSFAMDQRSVAAVAETVTAWRERYDIVVVDAPCLTRANSSGIPTAVYAQCFEGTALVIASGETPRDAVVQAVEQLNAPGIRFLGTIMTDRGMPSLRAEVDRQFAKFGQLGQLLKHQVWDRVSALPVFDERY